jgi:uncharacterized Zn finger protein (UPF0148 family)
VLATEPTEAKAGGTPSGNIPKSTGTQVQKTKAGIKVNTPAWDELTAVPPVPPPPDTKAGVNCPACSYLMRPGEILCAKCGTNIALYKAVPADNTKAVPAAPAKAVPADNMKTVRRVVPETKRGFRLVAVSLHDDSETKNIPLEGEHVVLNREMLDSQNNSISRSGHASLTFRDGEWWLENLSSLKSTFVQVNGPVRIQPGDSILLGDQLFRFKTD